jgi:hypothetical protein
MSVIIDYSRLSLTASMKVHDRPSKVFEKRESWKRFENET